jgi:hypothetical protein
MMTGRECGGPGSGVIRRFRRLVWYESGEGFAESGWAKGRPVALLRPQGWFALTLVLVSCGSVGLIFTPFRSFLGPLALTLPVVSLVVPQVVFVPRIQRVQRFITSAVPDAGGLICPRCLYDLRGGGDITKCPECGQSVDLEKLPKQWARTVRGLRYPDGDREAVTGWREV